MHQTNVTREQVYRAVMATERWASIAPPSSDLAKNDPGAFLAAHADWEERDREAMLVVFSILSGILETLANEMGINILAIRGKQEDKR